MSSALAIAGVAVFTLALLAIPYRRVARHRRPPLSRAAGLLVGGALAAGAVAWLRWKVFGALGINSAPGPERSLTALLLATLAFSAPLAEGAKVAVVWPLNGSRWAASPRQGVLIAVLAATGFALVDGAVRLATRPDDALVVVRAIAGAPAHGFCAGIWGWALASGGKRRGRWFTLAWVAATLVHGFYDHIVFGRGPGLLVAAVPMAIGALLFGWLALRAPAAGPDSGPVSSFRSGSISLPEPPSLRAMRRSLRRTERPLAIHWIAIGSLVTIGLMLTGLVSAVYLGNELGVDYSVADESDVRSTGPLLLLGSAVTAAFPIAGYLIARASDADSVLEPALGAALAIAFVLLALSITAPVALVVAVAGAPVAFGLACGGAWFGLSR